VSCGNWCTNSDAEGYRAKLVALRSALKSQVHAVLAKAGVLIRAADLFGAQARQRLESTALGAPYAQRLTSSLKLIDILDAEEASFVDLIAARLNDNAGFRAIQALPGPCGRYRGGPVSRTYTQAYRFALDPAPRQEADLRRHCGAARVAFNWGLALIKANLDQRQAERQGRRWGSTIQVQTPGEPVVPVHRRPDPGRV
jgi:hypothetical protein